MKRYARTKPLSKQAGREQEVKQDGNLRALQRLSKNRAKCKVATFFGGQGKDDDLFFEATGKKTQNNVNIRTKE